jgi:pyruvate/2-oxoglutarate dehydrogenase complex dihydrolipoamide dehydrogenase (E3) component
MKTMQRLSPILGLLLISGCATTGSVSEVSDLTVQVAEYRVLLAEQQGGLWADTDELLAQAKAAYAAGDFKRALELARKARFEGEMAEKQNISQQNAGPWQF